MRIDQLKRREFIALLGGAAVCPLVARAQPPDRMQPIGMLMGGVENDPVTQFATFRGALAKLGWTEASNLRIEVRWCADAVLCTRHAADLVALGPKALLAVSTPALAALQQQTRTIPIGSLVSPTRSAKDLSRAWHVLAVTSPASAYSTRRWRANGWRC
jgi:putative ABC transport system substrate-binding protein